MELTIPKWCIILLPSVLFWFVSVSLTDGYTWGWPFAQNEEPSLTAKATGRPWLARLVALCVALGLYALNALLWQWAYGQIAFYIVGALGLFLWLTALPAFFIAGKPSPSGTP